MIKGLPQKLKMLRLKYNLSQKEVANKLCVSSSIISGYETGERTPSTENILALSHLYHCTKDYQNPKENNTKTLIFAFFYKIWHNSRQSLSQTNK